MATTEQLKAAPRNGLLRRIIERPQQVWLRKAVFQVHLWAGVLLALYVIAIGISGSILVFKEELMPKPWVHIESIDTRACTAQQLTHAIDVANASSSGMKAFLASCPTPANGLFTITVREQPKRVAGAPTQRGPGGQPRQKLKQRTIYVHPQTGAVVGEADREASWVEWVEQFHVNLLLGRGGRLWNGIGASILLVLTLTGLILWWPGIRHWKRSLSLDLRRSWKRINWDLHNVMGFWTVLFVLTWALTGMYFTWPKLFTGPLEKISPIVTANYPGGQMKQASAVLAQANAPDKPLSVDDMILEAQRQSPDGHLEGVFYGTGPRSIFTVYMARGILGDYSNSDFVYLDQRSGRPLYTWHRGQNQTLGDWVVWLIAPLHFGTSWGQGFKALWALLGLALPVLTITGLLMYWNRWLSKTVIFRRR
jgi:uncharacterized iron-regulated membrane protein